MAGKTRCNRERDKHEEQILTTSLLAKSHTDSEDMATTACGYPQNGAGNSNTKGIFVVSDLTTNNAIVVNISSLQFHIRALYAIVVCLTVVLVTSLVFCYFEISSLREVLSRPLTVGDLVDFKFPVRSVSGDVLQMPYISSEDELGLGAFWEGGEFTDESGSKSRSKRHASFHEGSGAEGDWLWMSSFARVPIVALQSYCREAQLYCAASGKPGPPGSVGPKGDMGEKGEKGNSADETAIAVSLANIEAVRGPPGLQGEKGADGLPGPMGPKGEVGTPGAAGNNGINGYPGPRGLKGEPGTRGLLGFPGIKGDPGPVGEPGPKGAVGPPGLDGNSGMAGAKGDRGAMGPQGERGISGLPGVPGLKGLHGDVGPPGIDGMPGVPGAKGDPGYCQEGCDEREKTRTSLEASTPAPAFPPRVRECNLQVLGKPVFLHESTTKQGTWMKDLKNSGLGKIWVTLGLVGSSILEYSSIDNFKKDRSAKEIIFPASPYFGTGHLVYDGHFYYHWSGTPKIVRFDLTNGQATTVRSIPDMIYMSDSALKWDGFIYQSKSMFVHFNVDKNGLWIIYGSQKHEKLTVALLNTENLDIINSVTLNLEIGSKGGAFILCGKLYTLKHYNRQRSYLDEEYDLWLGKLNPIRVTFFNPYTETYMLSYDHSLNNIYAWDGGRILSLPILLNIN